LYQGTTSEAAEILILAQGTALCNKGTASEAAEILILAQGTALCNKGTASAVPPKPIK
jgi:predicted Rossmann-fold nucleotide-binding protein